MNLLGNPEQVSQKSAIQNLFQRFSLTQKMVLVTVVVGLVVWSILDYFQTKRIQEVFLTQLTERLSQQAMEDRLKFDQHIKAHAQSVRLFVTQKRFIDYLDKQNWSSKDDFQIKYHQKPPQWFPKVAVLRIFSQPRYALLLDTRRKVREVYQSRPDPPPLSLIEPSPILINKSYNQGLITVLDGEAYLIVSETFKNEEGELKAILVLASPIDDEFLITSLGTSSYAHMSALLTSEKNPQIIASSNSIDLPIGRRLNVLQEKYLIMGQAFFDYGASEVSHKFASFISLAEVNKMADPVIKKYRHGHAISALMFILSFTIIMFWITRRINRLTQSMSTFSQLALGTEPQEIAKGDQLNILEERFEKLTDEVLTGLKNLLQISLPDFTLEGILDHFIAEVISLSWLGVEPKAAIFLVEDHSNTLIITAHCGLDEPILAKCSRVPFGHCLCGKAAQAGELIFADHIDQRHEYTYDDITPHGHYCVPIISSGDNKVLGVFNLFTQAGFKFNKANEEFFLLAVTKLANVIKRKQAEEALKQAKQDLEKQNEELKKLDKMKDGLVRDLSHELKTPIAILKLQVDYLAKNIFNPDINEDWGEIIDGMQSVIMRQEIAIHNILDLSRLEAGGRKYRLEPLQLDKVIDQVLKDYQFATKEHDVEVIKRFDPVNIVSDQEMLSCVFSNLINNSLKYRSLLKNPRLIISIEEKENTVIVTVEDNGIGLTEEAKERAFEKFYQASSSVAGSGVGLSIVKVIVEGLNGKIRLESPGEEKGTTVTIELPL